MQPSWPQEAEEQETAIDHVKISSGRFDVNIDMRSRHQEGPRAGTGVKESC